MCSSPGPSITVWSRRRFLRPRKPLEAPQPGVRDKGAREVQFGYSRQVLQAAHAQIAGLGRRQGKTAQIRKTSEVLQIPVGNRRSRKRNLAKRAIDDLRLPAHASHPPSDRLLTTAHRERVRRLPPGFEARRQGRAVSPPAGAVCKASTPAWVTRE